VLSPEMKGGLLWSIDRGGAPAVAEDDVVDVLLEVWMRAVYGSSSSLG